MSQSPNGSYPPPPPGAAPPYQGGQGGQPPCGGQGGQPPYTSPGPYGAPQPPAYGSQPPYPGAYPPHQAPKPGGAGKVVGIVIAVVVGLFVIAIGGLMAIGLSAQDPQASGSTSSSTGSFGSAAATPSTSSGFADGRRVTSLRLHTGDCVRSKVKGDVSDLDTVLCTDSHDGEVIGVYQATGSSYPGEDVIAKEAETRCAGFVPKNLETSDRDDLSNYFIYPKRANWAVGDREVECLVVAEKPLTTPLSEL